MSVAALTATGIVALAIVAVVFGAAVWAYCRRGPDHETFDDVDRA